MDISEGSKVGQIYPEKPKKKRIIPFISLKTNIQNNFDFVFLKEDIKRLISSNELFLRNIIGQKYSDLKKVNFFVGHPVLYSDSNISYS